MAREVLPKRVREFIRGHPDTSPAAVLGRFDELDADDLNAIADALGVADPEFDTDDEASERFDSTGSSGVESGSTGSNPTPDLERAAPEFGAWANAEWSSPEPDTFTPERLAREQWMGRAGESGKLPFAEWADADHPEAAPDEDARWKWGIEDNYRDGETVAIAEESHRLDGRVFIQREDDPYAFVDGDDVRCPETNEVHPAFVAILEHLGLTYADVSTSGAGVHANYRGELPDDVKQATFAIDDEPWGANEDLPEVEIYDGKHVCVVTGDHVPGTPVEITEWDDDALRAILDANDQLPTERPDGASEAFREFDAGDHDPDATERDEIATDVRDIFTALDRLDARKVADQTIVHQWNDDASTSEGKRAFVPIWGRNANGTANVVDDEIWQDTGGGGYGGAHVMAAIACDDIDVDETATPRDVTGADWWRAVEYLRDEGFAIPEYDQSTDGEPASRQLTVEDLLESDATLSRREAWRAAATVTPDHLDEPLAIDADGDGWTCPTCGGATDDVVRAAALEDGTLSCCEDAFDDPGAYDRLYDRVSRTHGAPLPEYIPPTQAIEDMDRARGAVEALHGWHILDSLESEVTDDAPAGEDAVAVLDPTWEDSESGERIVLFQSGVFYCREHERVLWPLQVVALEQGLVQTETDRLGDAFFAAYAHARTTYDAPLPPIAWNDAEEAPEPVHLPVLPDAEDLLGEGVKTDASELDDARADVSDLYERLADSRGAPNYLLTAYPSLGKSHSAVVHANDYPTLYAATRKEIRQETAERAGSHGVSWMHLPTLGESRPPKPVLKAAVGYVREHGREALRDRDALLEAVEDTYQAIDQRWPAYEDAYGDGGGSDRESDHDHEDDEVHLDRAACECGDGDHGPEWHLALWTARQLGEKPRDLHVRSETIFGESVPCTADGECPYTRAWERATDPDAPIDLLIGHPVHAYVSGARTQPKRADNSDSIYSEDRVVVFDEFPAGAFMRDVGEEWPQHARWLAACLDGRVEDVTDLMDVREELWDEPFVREWLNAEASPPVADAIAAKREQASDPDSPDPDWQALVGAEFDVHGDLAALVDRAVEAAADPDRSAEELLDAAQTALQGGREGAEALASGAEDGYAHPDAYWLLLALLAPADHEPDAVPDDDWRQYVQTRVTDADHFGYGSEAARVKSVVIGDHVRLLVDRDMSGATLLTPPRLQANTVIGLDATGRPELWEPAVGGEFETRDIHETAAERRAFARDVLNLRVVQTSPHIHTYSSNPAGKNFGDDIALVEEIADTFGGHQLAQDRITTTSDPTVVTTKKVEDYIGDDLLEAGADSIDHYGDLIGSNRLGDATVGVILGAEHYGHDTAERWALLTGEEFEVSGHGTTLDYASPTANAMLRRMWDDQVMQAIMRFGRDEEGAVVFAHTAALRDDLPVVDHGDVATAWTANQRAVAAAAADRAGGPFTVADVAADSRVECHRRTVRRLLNEFADLGYMHREQGHTNQYELLEEPGTGNVDLPDVDTPGTNPSVDTTGPESGQTSVENTNTWFVWSCDGLSGGDPRTHATTPTLGPPDGGETTIQAGPPPR